MAEASYKNKSERDACVPSILEERTTSRLMNGLVNRCGLGIVSPTPANVATALVAWSNRYTNDGLSSNLRGNLLGTNANRPLSIATRSPHGLPISGWAVIRNSSC